MVATDVASRGIGMIDTPPIPPAPAMPSPFNGALLSTLRRFSDCVTLPGLFSSHGSLSRESWICGAAFSSATLIVSYTMYREDT
jgi:hypothetical protein